MNSVFLAQFDTLTVCHRRLGQHFIFAETILLSNSMGIEDQLLDYALGQVVCADQS